MAWRSAVVYFYSHCIFRMRNLFMSMIVVSLDSKWTERMHIRPPVHMHRPHFALKCSRGKTEASHNGMDQSIKQTTNENETIENADECVCYLRREKVCKILSNDNRHLSVCTSMFQSVSSTVKALYYALLFDGIASMARCRPINMHAHDAISPQTIKVERNFYI